MPWPKARADILMSHAARGGRVAIAVTIKADGHPTRFDDRVLEVPRLRDAFGLAFADALDHLATLSRERRNMTLVSEVRGVCDFLMSPDLPELDPGVAERIRRTITRGSAWNTDWHVMRGRFEPLDVLGVPMHDTPLALTL